MGAVDTVCPIRLSAGSNPSSHRVGILRSDDWMTCLLLYVNAPSLCEKGGLSGIVIRETRPGWMTLEVPPLEAWEQPLRWVTPVERERIESPQFYRSLEYHLTAKFLAQRMGTG